MVRLTDTDVAGARASNAGDRFHELWALRKALLLLEPASVYRAIAVEGIGIEGASPAVGTWSAVDVCLMSGGPSLASATRAEFVQLKYSSANPNLSWTVSRLCSSSAKKGNNSVFRKLAETFLATEQIRGSENSSLDYRISIVSNQPLAAEVLTALGKQKALEPEEVQTAKENRKALRLASGLTEKQLSDFASKLDLSQFGADELFEQERRAIEALDALIEGESRPYHLELHDLISKAMLPGGRRQPITEETLLACLGIGTELALYPCPNRVTPVSVAIERVVAREVVSALVSGTQQVALHGGAGCGKTTTIAQVAAMLPLGSVCIQFDCYGGGSYLDGSSPRHRPTDAFTQLSNEIATRLRVPRLLRVSDKGNAARAFRERLGDAAVLLRASSLDALLVIAVDAADNAVAAAKRRSEPCFIHDFVSFQDLPGNVRFVVSARSARLDGLQLPPGFTRTEVEPFSLDETASNVLKHLPAARSHWVQEFHKLTRGVPRVQSYAFELPSGPEHALEYLLPNGRGLNEIFQQAMTTAWRKGGGEGSTSLLCAALIALPRPVPLLELACAIESNLAATNDLCEDLGRTLDIRDGCVSFSDEDFEDFVEAHGADELANVRARIAKRLLAESERNVYAARHVVQALIAANREREAVLVATQEPEAKLFPDPVERRLCHLERMRSGISVARGTGSVVETLTMLLNGAEALRTSEAMAKGLARNPDLSARFARESLDRLVLSDSTYVEAIGPVLCHYMGEDARNGSPIQVARSRRMFQAWRSAQAQTRTYRQYSQALTAMDIAAYCRALLVTSGSGVVLRMLRRLESSERNKVFYELSRKLLEQRDFGALTEFLRQPQLPSEARLFLLSSLVVAGQTIDLNSVAALLSRLHKRGRFALISTNKSLRYRALIRCALQLCEVLVGASLNDEVVDAVLHEIALTERPRWQHVFPNSSFLIDSILRAECLLAESNGRTLTAHGLLDLPAESAGGYRSDSGVSYADYERQQKLLGLISAFLPLYRARAVGIRTGQQDELNSLVTTKRMTTLKYETYSETRADSISMLRQFAESVVSLIAFDGVDKQSVFTIVRKLLDASSLWFSKLDARVLTPFVFRLAAHGWLTEYAEDCSKKISNLKTSSSEKADGLLELSRLLLECSPETSASLFNAAVLVLGEIDVNEIRLLETFDKLSKVAFPELDPVTSQQTAVGLASFGTAVAFRLRDWEHFPWKKLSRGLTYLSAPVALAAVARWDDEDLAGTRLTLNHVLETALGVGSISPQHAAACSYFLEPPSESLVSAIVHASSGLEPSARLTIYEILAEGEALASNAKPRPEVDESIVNAVPMASRRRWVAYIAERNRFLSKLDAPHDDTLSESQDDRARQGKLAAFLDSLNWHTVLFDLPSDIARFADEAGAKAREELSIYFIDRELFSRIRSLIPANRYDEHLSFLGQRLLAQNSSYAEVEVLTDAIIQWHDKSMAVRRWCSLHLAELISAKLIQFMQRMRVQSSLLALIDAKCLPSERMYEAILDGLTKNIESFDAALIYELVEVCISLVASKDVAIVLSTYVERLTARVDDDDRFDHADIPNVVDEAFARFLYAYLGDTDLALRWKAAHSVRSLFWLEASAVLDGLILRYASSTEPTFRAKGAPFYWLAGRLWLTIAVSRAAGDRPDYAARYKDFLMDRLADSKFPHPVVQAFAKQAILTLVESRAISLDAHHRQLVSAVNTSSLKRKRRPRNVEYEADEKTRSKRERKFHFDALDTLRYWYPNKTRLFADITLEGFIDVAEEWIVERWGETSDPWKWDDEPRRDKFRRTPHATHHSHGELPRIERYTTHLEWHAMWCAVGELLKLHPLTDDKYNEDLLADALNGSLTAGPNVWRSDLRSPKPLEERFWQRGVRKGQVRAPTITDAVELLGLNDDREWCAVHGNYDYYWANERETVSVSSCLVSPGTAPALLRALQSSNDVHAHYLPSEDEDAEIDNGPFKLKGWVCRVEGRSGLDAKDLLAQGIASHITQPGNAVRKLLNLVESKSYLFGWQHASTADLVFYSEQWADEIPEADFREEADYARSKGERLHCKFDALQRVLQHEQCDLLIQIQTHKEVYESRRYSETTEREGAYFNTYILLKKEGDICDANGRFGTWKISR